MKYLWIGVGNSQENKQHIIENGGKILSAAVSNDAIISGMDSLGIECDSINCPDVRPYPDYPEKKVEGGSWSRTGRSSDCYVGYDNRKYINNISRKNALVAAARNWAEKNSKEDVTVFIYQMASRFMAAGTEVKKIIPNAKVVLIVPDLPQFMDMHMNRIKKILKQIDWKSIKGYMKSIDKYVLYSKHMAEFLNLRKDSYIVMEGSYDPSLLIDEKVEKDHNKISVMYSGVLDLRYGIPELLDAFELLDDRYELWLTGMGNAVELIKEKAGSDARIKYFGYFPTRRELLIQQKKATMLISPRNTAEEGSKYCFPSKIFEYMISGNPVISSRIMGIPDEYFQYLIPIENVDAREIAKVIEGVEAMSIEDRDALGQVGKQFVLDKKNNVAQAKKIYDMIL